MVALGFVIAAMRWIIFSLFAWLISIVPSLQAASDHNFLNIATQAADWILSREVDEDSKTGYWPSREDLPVEERCDLYYGNAGVLVFLRELHRVTGRKEYAEAMQRGIGFLDQNLPRVKLYGLYDGLAGIAFSLAQHSDDPQATAVRSKALDYLIEGANKQTNGGIRWNDDNDITSGSAGIGLTLLALGRQLHRPELTNLAVQAGMDLLPRAVPAAQGCYWLRQITAEKQYPNFSHGTAGIAYFLLRLYEQTGETRFLDAAIDGAKYLNSIASSNPPTRCLVPHELPEQNDLFYLAWCHGPAGTDRFLYQLFAVTNDAQWKTFADAAAKSVLHSGIPEKQTPGYWNNLSRCCGAVAVGEFFLARYRLTKVVADHEFAIRIGEYLRGRAQTDGAGLKWVQAENRIEPDNLQAQTGLMQGAAGIGLFFIHLAESEESAEKAAPFPDSPW
jgi:lantibiotic modifying enzyme